MIISHLPTPSLSCLSHPPSIFRSEQVMAAQLKEIVDRLNAEPFNLDLSLLVFDEKEQGSPGRASHSVELVSRGVFRCRIH